MRYISRSEYERRCKSIDFAGIYSDYDGKHPEWKGRRTLVLPGRPDHPGEGMALYIEGVSLTVVPDNDSRGYETYNMKCMGFDSGGLFRSLGTISTRAKDKDEAAEWARKNCPEGTTFFMTSEETGEGEMIADVKNELLVNTPVGMLKIERKGVEDEYPGIWVSLIGADGDETTLCMTEYDTSSEVMVTRVYGDKELEDPTDCIEYEWTAEHKEPDLKPFAVCVKENFHRNVVIYATDKDAAYEKAEELSNSGDIDLDGRDFDGRECTVVEEINEAAVENFQYVYGEEGE